MSSALLGPLLRHGSAAAAARRRVAAASSALGARRGMGGAQPESQSMKAELFGGVKHNEGYERIIDFTYIVGTALIFVAVGVVPDTSIKTWANNEASARMELKAKGKVDDFVFGVHYNTDAKYDFEPLTAQGLSNPFDQEEDDDEEDEDEEDDEDEDEDDDDE